MSINNRVFIAFTVEDVTSCDVLKAQATTERTPFEFVDMSVKERWKSGWKDRVRSRIKGCDGVIALISEHTYAAPAARFEMQCANEERLPMIGLKVKTNQAAVIPSELFGLKLIDWTWDGIAQFLKTL